MQARKLVKAGATSHTISLPKEWIQKHGLKKGDIVYIADRSDGLLITPHAEKKQEQKQATINIDGKKTETIRRELTSAYLNNYGTITLIGNEISEKSKDIRRILHEFAALEIVEQTAKRIVAKDLLNHKEISISSSIRKIDMLLRTMLEDIQNPKLLESVIFREYDINKTYFLLARIIRNCAKNSTTANEFGITTGQCIGLSAIAVCLESIGDCIRNIAETESKKMTEGTRSALKQLNELYVEAMNAYHSKNKVVADKVCSKYEEILSCLQKSEKNCQASDQLKRIAELINSIARITIDEE